MPAIHLGRRPLSFDDLKALRSGKSRLTLSPPAHRRMRGGLEALESLQRGGKAIYGVNTGFGKLCQVRIPATEMSRLQTNLLLSHAAGVGAPLPADEVRLLMALKAAGLAQGASGVRPALAEALCRLLNAGILPEVPEQGSVGASGDLAPMAHMSLLLIGRGRTLDGSTGTAALRRAGLKPFSLGPKEGLALINGTQAMTAVGIGICLDARDLLVQADVVGAMSLEALRGTDAAFSARAMKLRPHPGQAASAANLRRLLAKSAIHASHKDCGKVQDAYSLRCMPQVHGTARDAMAYVEEVVLREANAVTDNPVVFHDEVVSCGNFHGEPVAMAMDLAAIALAEIGALSERRTARLVDHDLSGLPPFLVREEGLNSGFMMAQVTAAALVSENKILAHPASVDSLPTSANQEDHVSMGMTAACKARRVLKQVRQILAIEALAAAQGLEFLRPLKAGRGADAAYRALRRRVGPLERDRELAPDIGAAEALLARRGLADAAEGAVGTLR